MNDLSSPPTIDEKKDFSKPMGVLSKDLLQRNKGRGLSNQSDFVTLLEMFKKNTIPSKVTTNKNGSHIKLNNGIEIHFNEKEELSQFENYHNENDRLKQIRSLILRVAQYFLHQFPKLQEEPEMSPEQHIEEALILTKHLKSPYQDEKLWERLKNDGIERYPHLGGQEMLPLDVVNHVLFISEDERLRKKTNPRKKSTTPKK